MPADRGDAVCPRLASGERKQAPVDVERSRRGRRSHRDPSVRELWLSRGARPELMMNRSTAMLTAFERIDS